MNVSIAQRARKSIAARTVTAAAVALTTLTATSAFADESKSDRIALFAQTVNDSNTVSEGYAAPLEKWLEQVQPNTRSKTTRHHYDQAEIWVADVGTLLFSDTDDDGYFSGFSLSLDVDVEWDTAEVFAKIYLQPDNADSSLLHTTNVFTIYERAATDRYRVEVELLDNYPAGNYDLIVDVVNASTGRVADSVSYATHLNLDDLPLESADYQPAEPIHHEPVEPTEPHPHGDGNGHGHTHDDDYHDDDHHDHDGFGISVHEYGGSTGSVMLLLLAAAAGLRSRRKTSESAANSAH